MCLVIYIGADNECPLIASQDFAGVDSDDPSWPLKVVPFSVEDVVRDERAVIPHFNTSHVYYAGSFEGCGCGFNACHINDWDEPCEPDERALAGRTSRLRLRDYCENNSIRQIYACWSCDEEKAPEMHIEVTLDQLIDWTFEFPERGMLNIKSELTSRCTQSMSSFAAKFLSWFKPLNTK